MASIAGSMKGGGGLGDVLPHDRHLADLPIAETKFVMRESNGTRIVRAIRLVECLGQKRNTTRGFAPGDRQAAVDPPEIRETRGVAPLAPLWRRAERLGRPPHVVLKQPGFRQSTSNLDLFVAVETRLAQGADGNGNGLDPPPPFQGPH